MDRGWVAVLSAVTLGLGGSGLFPSPARGADVRPVLASRIVATGDVATVAVSGHGFTAGSRVRVEVCSRRDMGLCDVENGESPTADGDGAIETELGAWATWTRTRSDGPDRVAVNCRQRPGCAVVATDAGGRRAALPLHFGPPGPSRGRYLDPVFEEIEVVRDVVYRRTLDHRGRPVELALDIYMPAGDGEAERPTILWLHGGWFRFGDKAQPYLVDYAMESARRGFVAVALDYRLRPDQAMTSLQEAYPAMLDAYDDAHAGVRWLQMHAADYRIDPEAISAAGWSAGATTSLNLAYLSRDRSPVAAALAVAGAAVAPVGPGGPPSIVFRATDDVTLPAGLNNTDRLCPKATAVGVACELVTYDGADHGIIGRSRDVLRRGLDFLAAQVPRPGEG